MANRIVIPVLGPTLSPYDAKTPAMQAGNVSENWGVNVANLGTFIDTTAATRGTKTNALSYGYITYKTVTTPNTVKAQKVFLSINSAAVNALANA